MADGDDKPITIGGLLKWGGVALAVLTMLGSGIAAFNTHSNKLTQHDLMIVDIRAAVDRVDAASIARHALQEKEIDAAKASSDRDAADLKAKQAQLEQTINDINRKLDVTIAILTRLDTKAGKP